MIVWTFFPNHETCVKPEGGFSPWVYDGKNPLSLFSKSYFLAQKHHLNKSYPDVRNRGFVEMKGNEGDKGLPNS